MGKVKIDNEFSRIWLDDGIIYNVYKPNLEIDFEVARLLVRDRLKVSEGKSRPLFIDISNLISVDLRARKYLSSEEGSRLVTAGAFYTTTPLSKFVGKLFIDVNQPAAPVQIFSNKSKAIEWLQQYK